MLLDHQFTFLGGVLGSPAPAGTVPNPLLQMELLAIIVIIILTIEVCIFFIIIISEELHILAETLFTSNQYIQYDMCATQCLQ